jgi:gluconokinase
MVRTPALVSARGTFCYRANGHDSFLLGCASSNGGNVLDWARREFGVSRLSPVSTRAIPIFLPWLNGERSLEWNAQLRPEWHGRSAGHTPAELFRAVVEGVLFNLAQYVEVIEESSGIRAEQIVLSGNGFLDPGVAPILAALVSRETLLPESSGLGTLRGTAVYAWRAIGHDAIPSIGQVVRAARCIAAADDAGLIERFARFKSLRRSSRNRTAG